MFHVVESEICMNRGNYYILFFLKTARIKRNYAYRAEMVSHSKIRKYFLSRNLANDEYLPNSQHHAYLHWLPDW